LKVSKEAFADFAFNVVVILTGLLIALALIFAMAPSWFSPDASSNASSNALIRIQPLQVEQHQYHKPLTLNDIQNLSNGTATITFIPNTNIPREIRGVFTTATILTTEDAIIALSSVRDIMLIDGISFICTEVEEREEIRIFHLQQIHQGIIVFNGSFRVIATHSGEPVAVIGQYVNNINLDITPTLTAREAVRYLPRGTSISSSRTGLTVYSVVYLVIYEDNNGTHLGWLFEVDSRNVLNQRRVIIDANTGEVLADIPLADTPLADIPLTPWLQ